MRWIWIDRFVEFVNGSHAKAIKNVTLAEDHLHDHFPGFPVMPQSLMLEGMAQTGGILLGKVNEFNKVVILAKVPKAHVGERLVADGEIVFAHVDENAQGGVKIDQKNFVFSMRLLGVMDVGKAGEGLESK